MSENRRTLQQYRQIDLTIWVIIVCVFEALACAAGRFWFASQPYSISVVPAVVAIVIMRWGAWALVHAAVGGVVTVLLSGGGAASYAVYIAGNLLSAVSLALIKHGKERITESKFLSALFALVTALAMMAGRAFVSLLFENSISKAAGFVTTDLLSAVFAIIVVIIVRNLDGVFEDQKHYLIRINKEEEQGGLA